MLNNRLFSNHKIVFLYEGAILIEQQGSYYWLGQLLFVSIN